MFAFLALVAGISGLWYQSAKTHTASAAPAGCTFLSNPGAAPAFCDTFNQAAGNGSRSGDLNGTVWGVSRATGNDNNGLPAGWFPTQLNLCGTSVTAQPDHDIRVCNGHIAEATNDGSTVTSLGMYVKQPFDISGRTGTVSFDVSDDSEGTHAAWPEFWYADQPLPDPFDHESSWQATPRNGLGVRFARACTPGQGANCGPNCPSSNTSTVVSVDSANVVKNYISNDSFIGGSIRVNGDNCVTEGSAVKNTMNHFELRINAQQVDVYGTDAFPLGGALPPLKHLATITGFGTLGLSRGVIWLEDVHYNANKMGNQGTHTFYWDNVGFDGPALSQDRTADVLDHNASAYGGANALGWWISPSSSQTVTTEPLASNAVSNASAALVMFEFWSEQRPGNFSIQVNGHSHTFSWPYPFSQTFTPLTVAFPLPVSDLVAGSNTVKFSTDGSYGMNVWNVDVAALGGGGAGSAGYTGDGSSSGGSGGGAPTPVPTGSTTGTPSASPTPMNINNMPCTVTLNGHTQSGMCSGSFTPSS